MRPDQRPSPEALLEAARRDEGKRGRLKLFLGAAPGVGKTYAMLLAARARRREGVDVVIGVVETHGRAETEALLDGLELLPRCSVEYKGRTLDEMALDLIVARLPKLVLVDELAHTNAPGSLHAKRYLDVLELLARGIDVYTTLNVQHVESLNDVVAQITGVRVRETVPDSVVDQADDIELVDLTPDDLMQRLREGKVYVPAQAERALDNYFSPGNLTALRELALRRTAQRVDDQLLTHMQAHAIPGPWAAGDRILVCISEDPRSASLVRYAKRLADQLHAPWTAVSFESRRTLQLSDGERDRVADALRLAERLGGETLSEPAGATRLADAILAYARSHNVTILVVGKSTRSRWFQLLHGSVVHDLVRRAGTISVHVIAGLSSEAVAHATKSGRGPGEAPRRSIETAPFLTASAAVLAALAGGKLIEPFFGVENVDLVFLTAIVAVAVWCGLWPSLAAVLGATLCYNFFFLPPLYTFVIADPTNVAALFFFTVVAVLVSNLAARARMQAVIAQERARTTEALYAFSRKLAGAGALDDVLWASSFHIASMLKVRVVLLLPDSGSLSVKAGYPPEDMLNDADLAAAKWAWDNSRPAGRGADTLPGAKRLFLPMRTGRGSVGVIGIDSDDPGFHLTPDQRRLLDALSDQGALAIERVHLGEDIERARLASETDRLRGALLTSLSHDLKTPLAAIFGSAGTLRDYGDALDAASKADLVTTILEESERLNRFIANLLDMTKLEAGAITPNLALQEIGESVGTALRRAARILAAHAVQIDVAPDLPMALLDAVLFEQVLFNLLDNAAKYAPVGTVIRLTGWRHDDMVCLQVMDEGPGVPPGDLERVFDKFHRARKADHVRPGTGLGLAIARGFVQAMGGTLSAGNRSDRSGAVFTISLPVPEGSEKLEYAA